MVEKFGVKEFNKDVYELRTAPKKKKEKKHDSRIRNVIHNFKRMCKQGKPKYVRL